MAHTELSEASRRAWAARRNRVAVVFQQGGTLMADEKNQTDDPLSPVVFLVAGALVLVLALAYLAVR
jgi:hypothetical protein